MRKWLGMLLGLLVACESAAACPRIISQAPYLTHSLRWLGLEQCIVGVSRYDPLERPRTGGILDPDPGAIARLQPELLLNADWIEERAWRAAVPAGSQAIRLPGFGAMEEIEGNLLRLAEMAGKAGARERAADFGPAWRRAAAAVGGNGRALVVAGCDGAPYAFGYGTYLHGLFSTAGFQIPGEIEGVLPLSGGEALDSLIDRLRPDWVFMLSSPGPGHRCPALSPPKATRVVPLEGRLFFHPAPILLEGLAQLERIVRADPRGAPP